jgi:membrane associated rhomboid family serine protease
VGASGAIFGVLGAFMVIEYQRTGNLFGNAFILIAINLAFGFSVSNIAIGGHIGGLIGGIASVLVLSQFGRGHVAYSRVGAVAIAGVVAIGAASIAIAYLAVG